MGNVTMLPPRIKIVGLPPSAKIPIEILQQLIGIVFPYSGSVPCFDNKSYGSIEWGYQVEKKMALRILRRKRPEVYDWFLANQHIFVKPYLFFPGYVFETIGFEHKEN